MNHGFPRNCTKKSLYNHSLLDIINTTYYHGRNFQKELEKRFFKNIKLINHQSEDVSRGPIFDIQFSPDDRIMVGGGREKYIAIFDPCIQSKIKIIDSQQYGINKLIFLDSMTFASCADSRDIALWDIRKVEKPLSLLLGHTGEVKSLNFNKFTKQLISCSFDNTMRLWNIEQKQSERLEENKLLLYLPGLLKAEASKNFDRLLISNCTGIQLYFSSVNLNTLYERYNSLSKFQTANFYHYTSFLQELLSTSPSSRDNKLSYFDTFPNEMVPDYLSTMVISPDEQFVITRYAMEALGEWSALHFINDSKRTPKLLKYIKESEELPRYTKELAFVCGGRVICSPFGRGVRLLGFDEHLIDMYAEVECPSEFSQIHLCDSHSSEVLCAKFANTKVLISSGSLDGKIQFYQPKL